MRSSLSRGFDWAPCSLLAVAVVVSVAAGCSATSAPAAGGGHSGTDAAVGSGGTGPSGVGGGSSGGAAGAAGGAGNAGGSGAGSGSGGGGTGVPGAGGSGTGAQGGAGGVAPLPGVACTDASPWTTTGTAAVNLVVNGAQRGQPWSRFYEKMVAADHVNTFLSTAWGRNIQGALKKGHDQAGFQTVRAHGMLNADMGVYTEVAGAPVYNFTRLDQAYDGVVAAGMRPFVEIGFMPPPLASDATKTLHWYNLVPANISPARDWTRWQDLMAALVQHLEQRYGATEVRNNWYFEIWNESSWMYSLGLGAYNALYSMTVQGLLRGDPMIKVGGPAETQGGSAFAVDSLIKFARTNSLKLDFISYHAYGQTSDTAFALTAPTIAFHKTMSDLVKTDTFTGSLFASEWGASYTTPIARDNEVSASFIAKTVAMLGTNPAVPPPGGYGYWTISDLYEEIDTGGNLAYREGNYGLLLKGDPRFPESFDVAKPPFNAFRLLHLMGDVQLTTTGGVAGDGVNATATLSADNSAMQILIYNHTEGGAANSATSALVKLTVNGLPFAAGPLHVRQYVVDRTHANSYLTWTQQGKPAQPTQAQWIALRNAAELCYYDATVTPTAGAWSVSFPQNNYSVSLLVISR
jgi:xylan 1,4-beta-xylosidase